MQIHQTDTLETVNEKLKARKIVLFRLGLRGPLYYAQGSRTDTLQPAIAYGQDPATAVRRLVAHLAPQTLPQGA